MGKRPVDWEAIEREYRSGQLSVSEIGRLYGVSHTAINKKAKRLGWSRDLAEKVRQEVSARLVSEGVSATSQRETIEQAAARDVEVIRSHRKDIGAGRRIVAGLFDELQSVSENRDDIEAEIEIETESDRSPKRRAAMLRAVSLGTRASTALSLASSLRHLVGLERQAFSIDSSPTGGEDEDEKTVIILPANGRD